jgi:NADH/NAD ratio-sensing transcriptional regulator Rex
MSVATRLSRYLQVVRRTVKNGAASISSYEIASYTGVNATQVRRDLSSFGKFGTRARVTRRVSSTNGFEPFSAPTSASRS